jgi:ABC-type multidrug transport system fused ATPase/permease subunit
MRSIILLARQSFSRLTPKGQRTLTLFTLSLILVSGLDAMALLILAKFFQNVEEFQNSSSSNAYQSIGIVIFLFLLRSVLSTGVSFLGITRFANEEVYIGQQNYARIEKMAWASRKRFKQSDYFTLIDRGPNILVQGLMLSSSTVVAESASALVIVGVLFITQPLTAFISLFYFLIVILVQHKLLSVASSNAGSEMNRSTASTYDFMSDASKFSKILEVMPSSSFRGNLEGERMSLAVARAKVNFLATLPRYFMETILALGFVFIAVFVALLQGEERVLPAIALFAAAGFRLLPIFNRIQGGILSCFSYEPIVRECLLLEQDVIIDEKTTLDSIELANSSQEQSISNEIEKDFGEKTVLKLVSVSYSHLNESKFELKDINLELESGKQYALVGPSGAGKTTLIDVILGLLTPNSGTLRWNPDITISMAYVPQETDISIGNLFQNIALEWDIDKVDKARANNAMSKVRLNSNFDELGNRFSDKKTIPENLLAELSGGQKQRLGLARAFYRNPNFIVLDEATSALDATLEHEIMSVIEDLRADVTTVIIAHRLSTIKNVDQVIYLENGQILGSGKFHDLIEMLPSFKRQVELGGLELK